MLRCEPGGWWSQGLMPERENSASLTLWVARVELRSVAEAPRVFEIDVVTPVHVVRGSELNHGEVRRLCLLIS